MAAQIRQPSGQIKLTNVSVVRLKKGGTRFEIACYKNKVQEWRNGVETDLDDVLQISNVFANVGKGELSRSEDLQKAFGTTDTAPIVREILKKGELQVGEKERAHELGNMWKELAQLVAEKCVDPATQRPYSVGIIEKAMAEAGFSVRPGKTAKSQVVECIKEIQEGSKLPIQRARMRVRVVLGETPAPAPVQDVKPTTSEVHREEEEDEGKPRRGKAKQQAPVADADFDDGKRRRGKARQQIPAALDSDSDDGQAQKGKRKGKAKGKAKKDEDASAQKAAPTSKEPAPTMSEAEIRTRVLACAEQVERQADADAPEWDAILLIDPGQFKVINDLLHKESRGRGRLETLTMAATA